VKNITRRFTEFSQSPGQKTETFVNYLVPSTPSLGLLLSTFSLGYICFSTSEKACSYTPAASRENSIWPTKTEYHGKGQLTPRKKK